MRSGIFAVANIGKYKIYIGETHQLKPRWQRMVEQFMQGQFPNAKLQQAWAESGEERRFTFHTANEITANTSILGRNQFLRDINRGLSSRD